MSPTHLLDIQADKLKYTFTAEEGFNFFSKRHGNSKNKNETRPTSVDCDRLHQLTLSGETTKAAEFTFNAHRKVDIQE